VYNLLWHCMVVVVACVCVCVCNPLVRPSTVVVQTAPVCGKLQPSGGATPCWPPSMLGFKRRWRKSCAVLVLVVVLRLVDGALLARVCCAVLCGGCCWCLSPEWRLQPGPCNHQKLAGRSA